MSIAASTTFALPSPGAGRDREARDVRKGWWIQPNPDDPTSWALVVDVEFPPVGGVSDNRRKRVLVTSAGDRLPMASSDKIRALNVTQVKQLRLDGIDPANPFDPEPAHNREMVSFARALSNDCVTEEPRTGSRTTETRRRPKDGNRSFTRMSFVRCGELARTFERSGLAVRPTHNLPALWKLTEAGERWLAEGLEKGLLDVLPQRVAA